MIKKAITVILGSFFLLNALASSRLQKDEAGNQGIHTTLVASRQSILPFESVSVMLLLVNETPEDKRVVTAWCSFLSIGKITANGTNWRGYRADNEPFLKPCVPTPKSLAPNESKDVLAHIDYEGTSGAHVFTNPGKYLLKGGTTDGAFVSDEIQITVRTPEGADAKAYEFLRTSYLHHFFGEYTVLKYRYDAKSVQDMEKFITDFDGSEYSYLARMGLAFMWVKGVDGKQDQSRAVELLTQVAERAGDPLASSAEYHLGRITYSGGASMLERQKKIVEANYYFQRVINGRPSPYFKYLAEEALHQP